MCPLVNFYESVHKVFWYLYAMLCTLLCFKYFGMMLVSLTPTHQIAAICATFAYPLMGLFCGFLIPGPVSQLYLSLTHQDKISVTISHKNSSTRPVNQNNDQIAFDSSSEIPLSFHSHLDNYLSNISFNGM